MRFIGIDASLTSTGICLIEEDNTFKTATVTSKPSDATPHAEDVRLATLTAEIAKNPKIVGVDAANDGLGGAAIAVLAKNGLAGKVPVTGQDATDEGLTRVLEGTQCVTVYKAIKKEADAASAAAIALANGQAPATNGTVKDSTSGMDVPSVLLTPQPIFKDNVKDVIADGFTTADKVCTTDELKAACAKYGVQ